MNPLLGEIWLADLGLAAKTRPVVIVSRQRLSGENQPYNKW
jgi:mRNA-degrading endonuclease toxin of MazEF toxin-antitoxin module